jgi:hypothetical protein
MAEKFEIGEKERHFITVDWDMFARRMTVELDGQTVFKGFVLSPFAKKFNLDVGTSEIHKVEVSAGIFSPIKVLVDGKPAQALL